MEWIAISIVFCFLMWRWPKRTLIVIGCLIGICIISGLGYFLYIKYDEYIKSNIICEIGYKKDDKEYAIAKNENGEFIALVGDKWEKATKKIVSNIESYENAYKNNMIPEYIEREYTNLSERSKKDLDKKSWEIYVKEKLYTNEILYEKGGACPKKYPIYISIENNTNKTIYKSYFRISAFEHRKSTNVIDYSSQDIYSDDIIKPKEKISMCVSPRKISEGYDPHELDWQITLTDVSYSNK